MQSEIPIFPVAEYEVGPVPSYGVVLVRFAFLASPLQRLDEAARGRHYALTMPQALALRDELTSAIEKLARAQVNAPPGTKQ